MSECVFCARPMAAPRLPGGVILEYGGFQVTHWMAQERPTYLGNLLIQTLRHVPTLADLSDVESEAFGRIVGRLSRAVRTVARAELIYLYGFQEIVRHVHWFLTARYPATPPEYLRLAVTDWPGAPRGDEGQVAVMCDQLRTELGRQKSAVESPTYRSNSF
jgi:histidine triad (HIT) family protein